MHFQTVRSTLIEHETLGFQFLAIRITIIDCLSPLSSSRVLRILEPIYNERKGKENLSHFQGTSACPEHTARSIIRLTDRGVMNEELNNRLIFDCLSKLLDEIEQPAHPSIRQFAAVSDHRVLQTFKSPARIFPTPACLIFSLQCEHRTNTKGVSRSSSH